MALSGSDNAVLKVTTGAQHADLLKQLKADPDRPLRFQIEGHPKYVYVPYWKIVDEPFTCFPVVDLV